jgi:hypothetical protein
LLDQASICEALENRLNLCGRQRLRGAVMLPVAIHLALLENSELDQATKVLGGVARLTVMLFVEESDNRSIPRIVGETEQFGLDRVHTSIIDHQLRTSPTTGIGISLRTGVWDDPAVDSFPEEHDLLSLLGEPELTDPGIPWAYNRLTFRPSSGSRSGEVVIAPGEGYVELRLATEGSEVVSVALQDVAAVEIDVTGDHEELVVTLARGGVVRLRVQPTLHLFWSSAAP